MTEIKEFELEVLRLYFHLHESKRLFMDFIESCYDEHLVLKYAKEIRNLSHEYGEKRTLLSIMREEQE